MSRMRIQKVESGANAAAPAWWRVGPIHVLLRCPHGHVATLRTEHDGHTIHADGSVHPSVVCPGNKAIGEPCTFHETIVLADWTV